MGIFHCFTGTKEQAQRAIGLKLNWALEVVTFKMVKSISFWIKFPSIISFWRPMHPIWRLLPMRKRNQSEYLIYILRKLRKSIKK